MPKNTLSSRFKAVFSEELKHHGFLLYKKTFYRIINDVVQTLMLNKTSTNFTLEFSILPLCLPIQDLFREGYDISVQGKRGWWDCLGEINEDIFSEAMFLFSQNVMPIFTRGIHSESAYSELINYEKMVYSEMPEGVYLRGYSFVMMCISYGNYKMAHNHLSVIVNRWDQAYKKSYLKLNHKEDVKKKIGHLKRPMMKCKC